MHVHRTTDTPTNEFSENNVLFLEAFPHLFTLGKGMPSKEVFQMTIWYICYVRDITSLLGMLLSFSQLAINACAMKH